MLAAPATADEVDIPDYGPDEVYTAPDGVSDAAWDDALAEAQDESGVGDKAYLDALKSIAPSAVTYCTRGVYLPWRGHSNQYILFPSTGSDSTNCVMEQGLTGSSAVIYLQQALNTCHQQGLAVDGNFGPATYNAVMNVQAWYGIPVDGIYGPQTRNAMLHRTTVSGTCAFYSDRA